MALFNRPEYIQPSDVRPGDIIRYQNSDVVPESRDGFRGPARVRFSVPITVERILDCRNGAIVAIADDIIPALNDRAVLITAGRIVVREGTNR